MTLNPSASVPKVRLISIDALRGLAALIILLYHARSILWVGLSRTWQDNQFNYITPDILLSYLFAPLRFGGLAVMLFFTLSGYCIHRRGARLLAENPGQKMEWFSFISRRIWRIYPTYIFALILTAIIDYYLLANYSSALGESHISQMQNNSVSIFVASLLSLQGIIAPYFGSNGVFWTLGIIFHFYLIYPFLFIISQKYHPVNTLKFSFLVSVIYLILNFIFNFVDILHYRGAFNPIFLPYLFTWTFGFYISEVESGRAKLPTQFKIIFFISIPLLIIIQILEFNELIPFCSAIVFGGIIHYSITPKGNQFYYNSYIGRYLAWIGMFSYSLFAFHVPLLLLFFYSLSPVGKQFTSFYSVLLISLFVICISYFLFLLVEKRTLQSIKSS